MAELIEKTSKTDAKETNFISASAVQEKAKENKAKRDLPIVPGRNVSFKEMQDWLDLLTPEQWDRMVIYCYRTRPITVRQLSNPDNPNYIDVMSEPFNEQTIIERHGGGKYSFWVNDTDLFKTKNAKLFEAKLDIPISTYPPKLNYEEVDVNAKDNIGYVQWLKAQGKIDDKGKPITQAAQQNPQQANQDSMMVPMFKMMMDFVDKMSQKDQQNLRKQLGAEDSLGKSIGELLLERMKQDDPNKQVATITALMGAMNKGGSDIATVMPMFLGMMNAMMESSKNQMNMMMQMFQNQNQGKGEEKDEISRLKDLLEVARELKGGNSGNKSQIAELIEAGAPVLQSAFNLLSNVVAAKATANGNMNVQPQMVKGEPTQVSQQQNTQQTQQPQQQTSLPTGSEAANIINNFKPIILNKLAGEGWEFGVWIEEGFGAMQAAAITKHGVEGLLAAAKMVPDFWAQIEQSYGEAHLRKWLDSLVNYKEIVTKMEEEEDKEEG
jgi:hypothetical protein